MGKRTALYPQYSSLPGVKIIDFSGWELPAHFAPGILEEHRLVREEAGLFDVSHMGEITIQGPNATLFLNHLITNQAAGLPPGSCLYTVMCYPEGGTVDDLLVYLMAENDYILVVNAANIEKDYAWIQEQAQGWKNLRVANASEEWALLALQGPRALSLLAPLTEGDLSSLKSFTHTGMTAAAGTPALISRTGYTGEDGFEIYCPPSQAPEIWRALTKAGAGPCGLGARDTLRLEARYPLYGQELSREISPLEAGLGFCVKLDKKEDFLGKQALQQQKERGLPRRLYGIKMLDRGVPREGYPVFAQNEPAGFITSGAKSPTLDSFIALALLKNGSVSPGSQVEIEIRGKKHRGEIVKTPFYKRPV